MRILNIDNVGGKAECKFSPDETVAVSQALAAVRTGFVLPGLEEKLGAPRKQLDALFKRFFHAEGAETVLLTLRDINGIGRAIDETMREFDHDAELQTRTGITRAEYRALRRELQDLASRLSPG